MFVCLYFMLLILGAFTRYYRFYEQSNDTLPTYLLKQLSLKYDDSTNTGDILHKATQV